MSELAEESETKSVNLMATITRSTVSCSTLPSSSSSLSFYWPSFKVSRRIVSRRIECRRIVIIYITRSISFRFVLGLIIDAFGELRDQLENVKTNMESNCFICGLGKEYFDTVPHGFDTHVQQEHNLANYM